MTKSTADLYTNQDLTYAEITHDPKQRTNSCKLYLNVYRQAHKELEMWEPHVGLDQAIVRALECARFYKAPIYAFLINNRPLELSLIEERILQSALPASVSARERNKIIRKVRQLCADALLLDVVSDGASVEHTV